MHNGDFIVFLISDFTGKTAETVINSVSIQFDMGHIETKKFNNVSTISRLTEIINQAKEEKKVILAYTLVLPELCDYLENQANKYDIPTMDILGPFMNQFSQILNQQPQLEVGLSYNLDHGVMEKMKCIDFNSRCDDGKDLNKLKKADIILIGVSRTSKTPVSMYLANQNYKVATISLAPEVSLPQELHEVNSNKIVGLTIKAGSLQKIRQHRLDLMEFDSKSGYTKIKRIKEELNYAQEIMDDIGCKRIDVTNVAVEDIANQIIAKF
ncbi:hypothetical protein Halha_1872 [Halobacteroides halobius DSM 5150]|uniref:Pyruvate, phosphate dikinase regulatory protein n=1 Tax=Halobacteroides halobius (strain ATCC 35273 / DSM 5150 / MD-1) TaxID=748449 RepID=L0KCK3_HALHC|nr:pyruvate, water dikinase regulatory protein [Halobacteroides halobius]AGB41783.1 hypothetical protein Halha_1872 [Halobacteroides halobius DSM 5150]